MIAANFGHTILDSSCETYKYSYGDSSLFPMSIAAIGTMKSSDYNLNSSRYLFILPMLLWYDFVESFLNIHIDLLWDD